MLRVNADDWGRDPCATDTTLACYQAGSLSSASAMVFLSDSERAAHLAMANGLELGLHINFTQAFDPEVCPPAVCRSQSRLRRFLTRTRYALVCFNPFLMDDFRTVFDAQLDEFERLYGHAPAHFDGHQHMHLATNMLVQNIIPKGTRVRRSFSFGQGEKNRINRAYRALVDKRLARRHKLSHYFFALSSSLAAGRVDQVLALGQTADVELMTHAWNSPEYDWLMSSSGKQPVRSSRACAGAA